MYIYIYKTTVINLFFSKKNTPMLNIDIFYSAPIINDGSQLPPSNTSTLRDLPKTRTPSVPDLSRTSRSQVPSSILPLPPTPLSREDIRLCTINRADATDTFGIELNFHRREQFHSLSITPGRENGPSSKIFLLRKCN
jgi:hypothetical protein